MRERQLDLSQPMARLTEDDVKTQRILMQEMVETGAHDMVPQYLIDYRNKMKCDKSLKQHHKRQDER
jgi:hypothetical protein